MGDIEKLIKKKIDVESIALDGERPSRGRYDGERGRPEGARERSRREHDPRDVLDAPRERRGGFRPAPQPRDPFFDKPYEATPVEASPSWEATRSAAPRSPLSANIKPKRKVAALFQSGE